ncbi:MAG: hypothetical protein ABG776_19555, partial [Cyanobacteria bacterium J06555_13]
LSSPEKRMAYDYKVGFSRISVMQPLSRTQASAADDNGYSSNAYIDPNDRPLSAGEFFALFILGLTFIACLVLVLTLSLTRDNVLSDLEALTKPNAEPEPKALIDALPAQSSAAFQFGQSASGDSLSGKPARPDLGDSPSVAPELPLAPWLIPKSK